MRRMASTYLTFRFDPPDDDGTECITFIVGGDHRGGIAEGRLSWTGGNSPAMICAMEARIHRWLGEVCYEQQTLTFMDRVAAGDPPVV